MPRKYAGPLQPGRKSAYVKGTRKNYRKKKGSQLPSRARYSANRTNMTRMISRVLANNAENKFQGYTGICLEPIQKPAGQQPISYHLYNTGNQLINQPEFTPMNLFKFPQGDGNDERIGNNMYIRKSHITMQIQCLPFTDIQTIAGDQPIVEFRLMVVKANRKYNPLGTSPDPGTALMLNTQNNKFGYDTLDAQAPTFYYDNLPINKRKFLVYKDQRFKLSYPVIDDRDVQPGGQVRLNTAYPKYATSKKIRINLPVYKKCHFRNEGQSPDPADDTPDNLDSQWLIILQAMYPSHCLAGTRRPQNYVLNMCGTTSAHDN
ncbi:MAG: putative capsid protein [Cressdnaviricota sp.]|nr:MAG: putative capsid protein [Cressdnaviricota sp.]